MAKGNQPNDQDDAQRQDIEDNNSPGEKNGDKSTRDAENLWEGIADDHPVRDLVRSLRSESAAKRTENNTLRESYEELKGKAAEMKSAEEFEAAIQEATQRADDKVAKARLEVARERHSKGLPESLKTLLKGDTEDEIKAHADSLRKDLGIDPDAPDKTSKQGPPKPPPSGGLTPGEKGTDVQGHINRLGKGKRSF